MVDSLQNFENWLIRIKREFPTSHKGKSFLRYPTEDIEIFKDVLISLSALDPLARSLALTELSCHNGLPRKMLVEWHQKLTDEINGGDQ